MSVAAILAVAPALPLHKAGKFVAAAYIVFLAVVLIYVAIMAMRLTHNQRELAELKRELEARRLDGAEAVGDRPEGGSPAVDAEPATR